MAVLKIHLKEMRTKRFGQLVRALGGREELAVGVLVQLWLRAIEAGSASFAVTHRPDYIICPFAELEPTFAALVRSGYLRRDEHEVWVPDVVKWIEGSERRRRRSQEAGKKSVAARLRKKVARKKKAETTPTLALAPKPAQSLDKLPVVHEAQLLEGTRAAWASYSAEYQKQFRAPPVRNAKTNALIKQFCKRIPLQDAPEVLGFYVGHGNDYYAKRMYPLDLAVKDAEGLYTQWVTNTQVTRVTMEKFNEQAKMRSALEEGFDF